MKWFATKMKTTLYLTVCLLSALNVYLLNMWFKAERQEEVLHVTSWDPPYVVQGEMPDQSVYLNTLITKANGKDCEAIYKLWEYYTLSAMNEVQSEHWLKTGIDCGCTDTIFLQMK